MGEEVSIRFGTYNIRNGRNGGLESSLRGCPRPKWTWASSRRKNAQKESTPVSRPDTASLLRTRRAETAAEWTYSTDRHQFLQCRP